MYVSVCTGIYLYAMQVENLATGKGLVFTRWMWFINPVHGFGAVWTACLILAVLRMTTTTLVSTWSVMACLAGCTWSECKAMQTLVLHALRQKGLLTQSKTLHLLLPILCMALASGHATAVLHVTTNLGQPTGCCTPVGGMSQILPCML